jgi:hypothetical protein
VTRHASIACAWLATAACGRFGFGTIGTGSSGSDGSGGNGDGGPVLGDGSRPDIVFTSNVVFVTPATLTPGTFGGLGPADMACSDAATAASLPGTYIAWLSTSTTNAIDRLAGSRGWVRPDGLPFVDQIADLAASKQWTPISLLADGSEQVFDATLVTTGTSANGNAGATCSDWTLTMSTLAAHGDLDAISTGWTINGSPLSNGCLGPSRVYCFGIGASVPVTTPAVVGRLAFVSTPVALGGGVASLDAHCQADADAVPLPGTYRALVATAAASAISRFDTTGPRWVRPDGIPLSPQAGDLPLGFRIPLDQHADGSYEMGAERVWTGATDPSSTATLACNDWMNASPSQAGAWGYPFHAGGAFTTGTAGRRCDDSTYGVYCLEM